MSPGQKFGRSQLNPFTILRSACLNNFHYKALGIRLYSENYLRCQPFKSNFIPQSRESECLELAECAVKLLGVGRHPVTEQQQQQCCVA